MAAQKKKSAAKKTGGSGKRNTGKKSTAGTKTKQLNKSEQFSSEVINDIKIIGFFLIMLLLELSNFSLIGKLGDYLSSVMFGLFGLLAYITPVLIFIGILFFLANVSSSMAMKKLCSGIVLFFVLCGFLQLIYKGAETSLNVGAAYTECSGVRNGGGFFGACVAGVLNSFLGMLGSMFVLTALVIICMVIITEKSFVGSVKNGSMRVYDNAREDFRKIKQSSAERIARKEEHKMERARNTVRGVNLNSKVSDENQEDKNVHELIRNGSFYRGPISDKMISEEKGDIRREKTVVSKPEKEEVKPNEPQTYRDSEYEKIEYVPREEAEVNEPGEFVPKEKIQVSKAAMETMRRKAFSTTPVSMNGYGKQPKEIPNDRAVPDVESAEIKGKAMPEGGRVQKSKEYVMPPLSLLRKGNTKSGNQGVRRGEVSETARKLQETLNAFGVKASVVNETRGPSVTRYELQPETGTKVSKITSLSDDIKLNLAASDIRIEAPIPGKAAVGIEVPNNERDSVFLRDLIESQELSGHPSPIAFAAGKDIAGKVIVADIAKMPHMLIAGTTGSGKSVFTNSIIMSILFRATPDEVKLIIVDPKVVEFGVYNGIPHLLCPVVTDPKKAAGALNWAVGEMTKRYQMFADYSVRDLKGYNEKIKQMGYRDGDEELKKMPQIVIIIDELADLMMVASKEVESSICRLAQLARAAGIHLIIATQRPSVDVVTGLIKANIPSRVALLVSSGTDSRTIIDCNGGEKLLGNGDMLFYPSGYVKPVRLQGAFVSDGEVQSVVQFLKDRNQEVVYNEEVGNTSVETAGAGSEGGNSDEDGNDVLFADAARFVIEREKGSTSMLQRMFKIGFNRASRIIEQLEKAGVVGADEGTKPRKVLMTLEQFNEMYGGS